MIKRCGADPSNKSVTWKRRNWFEPPYEYMKTVKLEQEPMSWSLHMHYILESTFARIFLFLEPTL